MVLSVEGDTGELSATVRHGGVTETYTCDISACKDPVCTCEVVCLGLRPAVGGAEEKGRSGRRDVEIDLAGKGLGYREPSEVRKADLAFAEMFLSQLSDRDFQILQRRYFEYKNAMTEAASPSDILGPFDYDAVESGGMMCAYNDILPYGDQLSFRIDGQQCVALDHYCVVPECSCSDVNLDVIASVDHGEKSVGLCSVFVDYKKRRWSEIEIYSDHLSTRAVKSAAEKQIPDLYKRIRRRHGRLRSIYAYSRKRDHALDSEHVQLPKVGRNDPCPCGSGKKYKKCCMA